MLKVSLKILELNIPLFICLVIGEGSSTESNKEVKPVVFDIIRHQYHLFKKRIVRINAVIETMKFYEAFYADFSHRKCTVKIRFKGII